MKYEPKEAMIRFRGVEEMIIYLLAVVTTRCWGARAPMFQGKQGRDLLDGGQGNDLLYGGNVLTH